MMMICRFLCNPWTDFSQNFRLKLITYSLFSKQIVHVYAHKTLIISDGVHTCTLVLGGRWSYACIHAQIVQIFCFENREYFVAYVKILSGVLEKFVNRAVFLLLTIFQVQGSKHTRCSNFRKFIQLSSKSGLSSINKDTI